MMAEWQKIKTAPKDGTKILGWFGSGSPSVVWWNTRVRPDGVQDFWTDGMMRLRKPTHWMHLPDPPEAE